MIDMKKPAGVTIASCRFGGFGTAQQWILKTRHGKFRVCIVQESDYKTQCSKDLSEIQNALLHRNSQCQQFLQSVDFSLFLEAAFYWTTLINNTFCFVFCWFELHWMDEHHPSLSLWARVANQVSRPLTILPFFARRRRWTKLLSYPGSPVMSSWISLGAVRSD